MIDTQVPMRRLGRDSFRRIEQRLIASPRPSSVCALVCGLAAVLVFVLPFAVPVAFQPAISASYVAGFNNHAAAIAAASVSLAVACWSWRRGRLVHATQPAVEDVRQRLSVQLISVTIALTCGFTGLVGWAIHHAGQRYIADAGYFIEQMSTHAEFGRALYTQLEFAYGPLLFYPTVWLQRMLHCSMFTAYFVTLAAEQSLGLVELAYILDVLPVRARVRRFAFVLFAFGALNPLLGLNYTLFRYLTPVVLLLLIARQRRIGVSMLAIVAGEAVSMGLSAEMGFGFAAGAAALMLYKAAARGPRWLAAVPAPAIGALLFVATAGRAYFHMLGAFARGTLNLPVAPYPHLLIFLFAVVWLAPLVVGSMMAVGDERAYSVVACYAFSVAVLPATLGRCDPIHVFFDGLVFCLLSLAAITRTSPLLRNLWVLCVLVFVLWQTGITNRLFRFRTADTLSEVLPPRISAVLVRTAGEDSTLGEHFEPSDEPEYQLDIRRLEKWVGSATVATPLEIPPSVEAALKSSRHFQSSYFAFTVDTFSAAAEQKKIDEMNLSEWALVPEVYGRPFIELPGNLQDLQGFSSGFPRRHSVPFLAGDAMATNLRTNWRRVDQLGPYLLLQRTSNEQRSQKVPAPCSIASACDDAPHSAAATRP